MYVPSSFAVNDPAKLHAFIRQNSFATMVSQGNKGLIASHLPFLLEPDSGPMGHLVGHMARANDQWRQVEGEVLVIFDGPHAYISPSWYEEEGTVPTWNYVAVHAYGRFQVLPQRDDLLDILRRMVQTYEGPRSQPWVFDESAPYVQKLLETIVGFRIELDRIEGKWKLGQNHSEVRRRRAIRALQEQNDPGSQEIAALMAEWL
jgi:transcriptional regulator